jgi:hypothetical protein
MSRPRFKAIRVPSGRIILDRKTGAWYLISAGRIIDYGRMRERLGWTIHLKGASA